MRSLFFLFLIAITLLLSSCLYENAPSQPLGQLDTWLLGHWIAQDKSGKIFEATLTPQNNIHYHVSVSNKDKNNQTWEFDGWISRVDDLQLLTLRSLSQDARYAGKYLFFHYELLTPEAAPINGVGARRMRLIQLQLPKSAETFDSYHLRQAIRKALKENLLLLPEGSSVWTRTGDVYWPSKNDQNP
jgi:hypothetical protein